MSWALTSGALAIEESDLPASGTPIADREDFGTEELGAEAPALSGATVAAAFNAAYTGDFEFDNLPDGLSGNTSTGEVTGTFTNQADEVYAVQIRRYQSGSSGTLEYEDFNWTVGEVVDVTFDTGDVTSPLSSRVYVQLDSGDADDGINFHPEVDYGEGGGFVQLSANGNKGEWNHTYGALGTYNCAFRVRAPQVSQIRLRTAGAKGTQTFPVGDWSAMTLVYTTLNDGLTAIDLDELRDNAPITAIIANDNAFTSFSCAGFPDLDDLKIGSNFIDDYDFDSTENPLLETLTLDQDGSVVYVGSDYSSNLANLPLVSLTANRVPLGSSFDMTSNGTGLVFLNLSQCPSLTSLTMPAEVARVRVISPLEAYTTFVLPTTAGTVLQEVELDAALLSESALGDIIDDLHAMTAHTTQQDLDFTSSAAVENAVYGTKLSDLTTAGFTVNIPTY